MAKRIYLVRAKHGAVSKLHLIRAHSHEAAIRKASEGQYVSELASQDTLVKMIAGGHQVVDAGTEQAMLPMGDAEVVKEDGSNDATE